MKSLKKTLFHTLEILVIGIAVYFIAHWFTVDPGVLDEVVTVLVLALAKFARESERVPLKDYVNS